MIHSEENNGFDIALPIKLIANGLGLTVLCIVFGVIIFFIIRNDNPPTTKPPQTELSDKCPANVFKRVKLTGSFNSIKTDSVKTDKLNFPSYCPLVEDKPKNYGTKK